MKCVFCNGQLIQASVPFSIHRRGYGIYWDAVPALVCSQCGEPVFEERTVALIEKTIRNLDRELADMKALAQTG